MLQVRYQACYFGLSPHMSLHLTVSCASDTLRPMVARSGVLNTDLDST